jgi:hypothetical protein
VHHMSLQKSINIKRRKHDSGFECWQCLKKEYLLWPVNIKDCCIHSCQSKVSGERPETRALHVTEIEKNHRMQYFGLTQCPSCSKASCTRRRSSCRGMCPRKCHTSCFKGFLDLNLDSAIQPSIKPCTTQQELFAE